MVGRLLLLLNEERRNNIRINRIFRDRSNPLDIYNDVDLYQRYRFDRPSILHITDLLANQLNTTKRNYAMLPVQQVLMTLRYYATGTFQIFCGDDIRITKSAACKTVWKVTSAILNRMSSGIQFPVEGRCDQIKSDFYKIANFPGVLGLVDGTHIRIQRPSENENDYINRKYFPSINVQSICDSKGRFLNVCAKWPGSMHDAFVWSQSRINAQFEAGRENGFILGDSGYPCKPWLLTPFRNPENRNQLNFNAAHRRTRVIIEQTFGRWKRRFHIMHGEVRIKPSKVTKLIIATSILHNLAIDRNQRDFDDVFEDELEGIEIADYNDALGPENGKTFRLHIANSYFHL